jgi:hypothetical protein
MKLTKGKISKLYKKKIQSRKRRKDKKTNSKKRRTFRKNRKMNLAKSSLKKFIGGTTRVEFETEIGKAVLDMASKVPEINALIEKILSENKLQTPDAAVQIAATTLAGTQTKMDESSTSASSTSESSTSAPTSASASAPGLTSVSPPGVSPESTSASASVSPESTSVSPESTSAPTSAPTSAQASASPESTSAQASAPELASAPASASNSAIAEDNFKLLMTAWSDAENGTNEDLENKGKKYLDENFPEAKYGQRSPERFAKETNFAINNDELKDIANYTFGPPPGKFRTIENRFSSSQ